MKDMASKCGSSLGVFWKQIPGLGLFRARALGFQVVGARA